jgi:hypothetical protein
VDGSKVGWKEARRVEQYDKRVRRVLLFVE